MPSRPATFKGVVTWDDEGVNRPEHPIHYPEGHPSHPIHMPPGVNVPVFPTFPIWITDGEGHPAHPIVLPDPPPTIWPGPGRPDQGLPVPPYVDNTLPPYPGYPAHPIWIVSPGRPTHPIYLPPGIGPVPPIAPGGSPSHPIVLPIPPDGVGSPSHPIVLPIPPGTIAEDAELYFSPTIGYFIAVKVSGEG
jgi:hypothetical protein